MAVSSALVMLPNIICVLLAFSTSSHAHAGLLRTSDFSSHAAKVEESSTTSALSSNYGAYHTHFFTQNLDHFTFLPSSFHTFQQRYLVNTQHWAGSKRRAPIFVFCGGQDDITQTAADTGFLSEIAPRFQAMLVYLEHRYYGVSVPGLALRNQTPETMGYLTAEQAIADYALIILDLKKKYSAEESPVVLFGGAYGGMLAAWFRLKYPHIAIGALASSAPILEFGDLVPSDGFYRIVSDNFKAASVSCFDTIKRSWDALNATYQHTGGQESVAKKFRFCSDILPANLETLHTLLRVTWARLALTNYPYPTNFTVPLPANPVNEACRAIDSLPDGTDLISRVAAGINVYYNGSGQAGSCIDVTNHRVPSVIGYVPLNWQACTELIFPVTINPNNSMFPAAYYGVKTEARSCKEFLGVYPRPHWITQEFGGKDIRLVLKHFASNIIFSNGLSDPWSSDGVLESISDSVVALTTEKGTHLMDLRASTAKDPSWLIQQWQQELQHVQRWLRYYYAHRQAKHS